MDEDCLQDNMPNAAVDGLWADVARRYSEILSSAIELSLTELGINLKPKVGFGSFSLEELVEQFTYIFALGMVIGQNGWPPDQVRAGLAKLMKSRDD